VSYDATKYIQAAIDDVLKTLAETLLIIVIVIFLFLGFSRSVLIPLVAIPLSLIGAVFVMKVFGFSLNLLTLLSIVLSVGLVVDDAIVMVENIERHIQDGLKPFKAALVAARELGGPIIAMTVTLVSVYVPIGLQGGLTGTLFREFAITLAGAVTISAIVAITLSPMMASKMLKPHSSLKAPLDGIFNRFKHFYSRQLDKSLNNRIGVYVFWIGISALCVPVFTFLKIPAPMPHFTDAFTSTLNIYSQVGLVTLIGLIARNGILVVEFANKLQEQGKAKLDAIREASVLRLRPVMMTSLATIAGHTPLIFATGAGAGARNSIGIVLVLGMAIGTIFTLFVLPSVYMLIAKDHSKDKLAAEDDGEMDIESV